MNKTYLLCAALAAILTAACTSVPEHSTALEDARAAYDTAARDPGVTKYAPLELRQASDSFQRAESAWRDRADQVDVSHLAYLAKQRAAIAVESARQKSAEAAIETARADRDRIRLEARTREAEQKSREAELAQQRALSAQRQARDAEQRAQQSEQQAAQAQLQADASQRIARENAERARLLEEHIRQLEVKPTPRGLVMTLGDVLFDTGKSQLKPGAQRRLEKLADFMKQYPQRRIVIEGFTDSTGSDSANLTLSERRAEAVRVALIDQGIGADRITVRGYGEAYPIASNHNTAGRQLNRRVEIVISDDSGNVPPRSTARL